MKALLAYLNSSFAQFYIETHGRRSRGEVIALEEEHAKNMPINNPRNMEDKAGERLAELFASSSIQFEN